MEDRKKEVQQNRNYAKVVKKIKASGCPFSNDSYKQGRVEVVSKVQNNYLLIMRGARTKEES